MIVVAGRKGGVGKSFAAKLIAINCATGGPDKKNRPLKTLLIEVDSQQNLSYYFLKAFGAVWVKDMDKAVLPGNPNCPDHAVYNVTDIFMGNDFMEYPTEFENLFILPSDGTIDTYREKLNQYQEHDICKFASQMFKEFIELIRPDYDVIVIDTPPTKTYACRAAMSAADDVLIVTELDTEGVRNALPGIMGDINNVNREYRNSDNPLSIIGILPNKISSKKLNNNELKNLNIIIELWPEYIDNNFFFTKRVDFQTADIPGETTRFPYMKNEATAEMVRNFHNHLIKKSLSDIVNLNSAESENEHLG